LAASAPPVASLWVPTPARLLRLMAGLWLFGTGEGLLVHSDLGNSPWTVLAEGVSVHSPLSIGAATIAISFGVLLVWVPLRQRPGLGTIANAILIGIGVDVTLSWMPSTSGVVPWLEVLGGIALVGLGSGLYINAALGPGPRDGLMTGIHRRTGWPIAPVRAGIEITALTAGVILGGTAGVGTLAFALGVGPAVALGLRLLPEAPGERFTPSGSHDPRNQ
jgi:uncharacterized membrane protein YczE